MSVHRFIQNRIRNAVSYARAGRVERIEQLGFDHDVNWFFLIFFGANVIEGQIESIKDNTPLTVDVATGNTLMVKIPDAWKFNCTCDSCQSADCASTDFSFEPLIIGPSYQSSPELVAFTRVCAACGQQYDETYWRRLFEKNPARAYQDMAPIKCCLICETIEQGKQPKKQIVAVQPIMQQPVVTVTFVQNPTAEQDERVKELREAAQGVLGWYARRDFLHGKREHDRLADALKAMEAPAPRTLTAADAPITIIATDSSGQQETHQVALIQY